MADFDELIHKKIYRILRSGLIAFADSEQRPSLKQKISLRCLLVTFFFFFFVTDMKQFFFILQHNVRQTSCRRRKLRVYYQPLLLVSERKIVLRVKGKVDWSSTFRKVERYAVQHIFSCSTRNAMLMSVLPCELLTKSPRVNV